MPLSWRSSILDELRRQRTCLDQAIAAIEALDTPAAPATTSSYVATPAPAAATITTPRKQLKAGKPQKPSRVPSPVGDADADVLRALRTHKAPMRVSEIGAATGLDANRLSRARNRLLERGLIVVSGKARAARWALPGAKEAP